MPIQLLPRWCPLCRETSIIGHGKRRKQAHDEHRDWIWVRRGLCLRCGTTFTVLPLWSLPYTHYSLLCREQACRDYQTSQSAEKAAPPVKDAQRMADGSTVRRWLWRRVISWRWWLLFEISAKFRLPTIFAWDWPSAAVNLRLEALSP